VHEVRAVRDNDFGVVYGFGIWKREIVSEMMTELMVAVEI
jgi:hypothetical protein